MHEVKASETIRDGQEVTMWSSDITNHNILGVSAGTTGHCGDKYDCRTYISIQDQACTNIRIRPLYPEYRRLKCQGEADGVEITLVGDSELDTLIEGLAFLLQTLRDERKRLSK